MSDWLAAIILGLVEGLTEFIPVSSTGHMLLLGHFMGFQSAGKTFEIVIQLGALLAIVSVYFKRLWALATRWPFDPEARRFLIGLLVAFAPAVVIGFLVYDFIKGVLFETPQVICIALIVGGVILLALDRMDKRPKWLDAEAYPMRVDLDGALTLDAAHAIVVEAERRVLARFPGADILIHADPRGRPQAPVPASPDPTTETPAEAPNAAPAAPVAKGPWS